MDSYCRSRFGAGFKSEKFGSGGTFPLLGEWKLGNVPSVPGFRPPAFVWTVTDAVREAEEILREIDRRWPPR